MRIQRRQDHPARPLTGTADEARAETRRGHPARLRRGAPLPEVVESLPSVEAVRRLYDRTNASGVGGTQNLDAWAAGPWWPTKHIDALEAPDLEEGDLA